MYSQLVIITKETPSEYLKKPIRENNFFYLQCKAQGKKEQLLSVNEIHHHRSIVQVVKIHINGCVFVSYTAHWNSCTQLIPKSICIFNKSYWFIQSGRDAALTVLSVALSSALKLWSWHCNGIVPPRHDQKTNHLLYAVNDEIAAHFLPVKQD